MSTPRGAATRGPVTICGTPSKSSSPASTRSIPPIHLISVVLPAPLSPTRAVTSPAFAVTWTDDNTLTGPNDLSTPRSSNVAAMSVADAVGGAQLLQCRGRAYGRGGQIAIGHRLGDVRLGDHCGRGQERGHLTAVRRVPGRCRRRRLLP